MAPPAALHRVPRGSSRAPVARRGGFTLLEVAVTIVIVGMALTLVLQVLNNAQLSALQTRNEKLARELGLRTLGRIASGLYREEARGRFYGSYAEDDQAEFEFEVALGDEVFPERSEDHLRSSPFYDPFNDPERRRLRDEKAEEEKSEQPYERVKVRVAFPKVSDFENTLILERWLPWTQVYGEKDEQGSTPGGRP